MSSKSSKIKATRVTVKSAMENRYPTKIKKRSNFKTYNGLVNDNGLTNGKELKKMLRSRRTSIGLLNGNGLSNGLSPGSSSSLEIQAMGLINGNGLTNGNGLSEDWSGFRKREKFFQIAKIKAKNNQKRLFISILAIIFLLVPLVLFVTNIPSGNGIKIDGKFNDWKDVQGFRDHNDVISGNKNIDIISYKTTFMNNDLFIYFQVNGRILDGFNLNKDSTMIAEDTILIFLDVDRNQETGYSYNYMGADYLVKITGYSNKVSSAKLMYFDPSRYNDDWNSWVLLSQVPIGSGRNELEVKIPFSYISNYIPDKIILYANFRDYYGNEDFTDTIFAPNVGVLDVNIINIAPDILRKDENNQGMILINLNSVNEEMYINGITVTIQGTASEYTITEFVIWDDINSNSIFEPNSDLKLAKISDIIINNRAKLEIYPSVKLSRGTNKTLFISGKISNTALDFRTINLVIEKPTGISVDDGLVSFQPQCISNELMRFSYIGNISNKIEIDGAFGDWSSIDTFKDHDEEPILNKNIDIDQYKIAYDDNIASFYCSVHGTMMAGTSILMEPNVIITRPDLSKPVTPKTVPSDNGSTPKTVQKPKQLPELIGEDTICLFLDVDNNHRTGYYLFGDSGNLDDYELIGAEYLLKFTGKNGIVKNAECFKFMGKNNTDWSWSLVITLKTGCDSKQLETQISEEMLNNELADGFGVWLYAHDWNNNNQDNFSLDISSESIQYNNYDVTGVEKGLETRGEIVQIESKGMSGVQLDELMTDYNIEVMESYESFILANITTKQKRLLIDNGYDIFFSNLNERTIINTPAYIFNTVNGEPSVPDEFFIERDNYPSAGAFILQFIGPIKETWVQQVNELGVGVLSYIPNYAYLVWMNSSLVGILESFRFVEWVGLYQPAYKLNLDLLNKESGQYIITVKNSYNIEKTLQEISEHAPVGNISYDAYFDNYNLILDLNKTELHRIIMYSDVLNVQEYNIPHLTDETSTEIVGGFWTAGAPWDGPGNLVNSLGWNGSNVIISIADTGIGDGTIGSAGHVDFGNRVINGTQYGSLSSWVDGNAHGTHVAGIVAGDGYSGSGEKYPTTNTSIQYYVGMGMAPEAQLFAQRIFSSSGLFQNPGSWDSFFQDAYDAGSYIHQNSWGENPGDSAYETYDVEYDQAVRDSATSTTGDQAMVIVVAAGNSGSYGEGSIQSPASGKNVISVGATENYYPDASTYGLTGGYSSDNIDDIPTFSSRGFDDDGRIKPDIMAPGTNVLSARSPSGSSTLHGVYSQNNTYLWCSGTSQACPHVSGAAANILDWWQTNHNGTKPSPALIKAMLINTAIDIGASDRPNVNEGWGRMYLPALFDPPADMIFKDQDTLLRTGNKTIIEVYVTSSDHPLNITLVWTDPAASVNANPALVNNLDMKLTAPDGYTVYYGNVFNNGFSIPGSKNSSSKWDTDSDGFDERNNVECIFLPTSAVQPGSYKLEIIAENIPVDSVGSTTFTDQDFALVVSGDLRKPNDVGIDDIKLPKSQQKNANAEILGTVRNFGLKDQTVPFNVRCIIQSPGGQEVLNSTKMVNFLSSLDSKIYSWDYTPNVEGKYTVIMRTELSIDEVNWNNVSIDYMAVPFNLYDVASITGKERGDRFGWNVSSAGDVNGDGYSDIIIGAPFNDSLDGSLSDAGAAYVFFGPKSGNLSSINADVKLYGTSANDHFGWDVSGLGDINGTYDDVIIGAPGNASSVPGKAYIFHGWTIKTDADGTLLANAADADAVITGGSNGDRFGSAVSGAGDVNNDNLDDVLIGAYLNDSYNGKIIDAGMVYLFLGSSNLIGNIDIGSAVLNLSGGTNNARFGTSVSSAGDINQDSFDDILIGAPGLNRAFIYYGLKNIIPSTGSTILFNDGYESGGFNAGGWILSTPAPVVTSLHPNSGTYAAGGILSIFGYTTNTYTFQRTIDTTGFQNINIAYSVAVNDAGAGTVSFTASYSINGGSSWTDFEAPITNNKNVYASKQWDLSSIAGAYNNPDFAIRFSGTFGGGTQNGANCFWVDDVNVTGSLIPGNTLANVTFIGENIGDNFGWSVNCSGDVNGDSYEDVIIGAPEYNDRAGRVYVFYGKQSNPLEIPAVAANVIIDAGTPGDKFGYSVSSADLSGDGFSDLLVGAPFNDTLNGSLPDAGIVYVFNGSATLNGIIKGANFTRSGENAFDHLGWSVGNAQDTNLINCSFIISGAPHFDNGSVQDVGKVYILATVVISEYNVLVIPIIFISVLILATRKIRYKKDSKE